MFINALREYLIGVRRNYTFILILLYSIIASILPSYYLITKTYPLVSKLPTFSNELLDEIYPQELEVKIQNGKASTNVTEPYYVTIKVSRLREILESFSANSSRDLPNISSVRLLTIDTNASIEDYYQYQTLFLLTRENFVYQDDNDVKFRSLAGVSDITITKGYVKEKLREILENPVANFLITKGVYLLIPLTPFFSALAYISTSFFFALFLYLMARIMQTGISYKQSFSWITLVNFPIMLLTAFINELPRTLQILFLAINDFSTMIILSLAYIVLLPMRGSIFKNETSINKNS